MKEKQSPYCQCLYFSSNALARVMTKMAEDSFAPSGLSPSNAFVVMSVNKNPGILSGELAKLMMLTPSTVSRLIEKLEDQELVKKMTEGRNSLVFPTKQSVALNEIILHGWQELYKKIVALLGQDVAAKLTMDIFNTALILSDK